VKTFFAIFLAMGLAATGSGNAQNEKFPKFTTLSSEDSARLDQQRDLIAATVKQHYGVTLTRSRRDLAILQRLVDDSVFNKTQTYELQSLGVAFGDVLVSALPLHWEMITDEYGTDPTLRYKSENVNINALTMISKRLEKGQTVRLEELLNVTKEQLANLDKNSR
jgi:hypothetical protein